MKKTACLILICLFMLMSLSAGTAFDTEHIPVTFITSADYNSRTIQFVDSNDNERESCSFNILGILRNETIEEEVGYIKITSIGSTVFSPRLTVTASEFFMQKSGNYYVLPAKYLIDSTSINGTPSSLDNASKPYVGMIDLSQAKADDSPAVEEKSLDISLDSSAPQLTSPATYKIPISIRINRADVVDLSEAADQSFINKGTVPAGSYTSYVTVTYWEVV